MRARTTKGIEIDFESSRFDSLRPRLKGALILPGEPAYDDSRAVWNAMIDRRPLAVVRCLGVADVVAAVLFAREHDLLLSIKGGGHNIAGLAVAEGALMLDLGLMRGVWVDAERRIARAQGGCLLGDVNRETQLHGLAAGSVVVLATVSAGPALRGRFGYLTRRFGWTSDNVVGMEVVTAEGQVVRASSEENSDLFWGLRGGGGNFGVVTGIDYALYPVGPEIVGGVVAWPQSEAPRVLELYRRLAAEAPEELTLVTLMRPAPPAPWLPKEMHGQPIVAILACHTGPPEEAEKTLAAIKTFGQPVGDILVRRPYAQMQALLDATQPKGRRYYWKSEYLPEIAPELCAAAIAQAAKIRSPHSAVIFFQIAGALNRLAADHSPGGNRDARYVLNIAGAWERPEDDAAQIAWARDAWDELKRFSTGGNYVNFLTEDESPERVAAALGPGVNRLAEVKKQWDPENRFRVNRNIQPA